MQWAARSSGRVRLNDPRNDFASGVRELATMTASRMTTSLPRPRLVDSPSPTRAYSTDPSIATRS